MTSVRYLFSVSCRLPIERTLLTSCFPLMLKICPEMALCIHSCTMLSLILSCWGPNTVRRLWVLKPCFLGSYGSYRPLRKKINVKLHGLKPDCTEIQADFRRQLEYRTLLQPPPPPNKCHMSVHNAFWLTAMWLTFDTEKMPEHLGPHFLFGSLLQSYLIWLRGKTKMMTSRPGILESSPSARQISGYVMVFMMVHRGKSWEALGNDVYVACMCVQIILCVYVLCRATEEQDPLPSFSLSHNSILEVYLACTTIYTEACGSTYSIWEWWLLLHVNCK